MVTHWWWCYVPQGKHCIVLRFGFLPSLDRLSYSGDLSFLPRLRSIEWGGELHGPRIVSLPVVRRLLDIIFSTSFTSLEWRCIGFRIDWGQTAGMGKKTSRPEKTHTPSRSPNLWMKHDHIEFWTRGSTGVQMNDSCGEQASHWGDLRSAITRASTIFSFLATDSRNSFVLWLSVYEISN